MCLFYRLYDRTQLLFLCLIYGILMINTLYRTIRGNRYHIHSIDITKLLLLRQGSTCHTCLLIEFVKEILERDGRKRFALSLHLHVLFCFNRLMQTIRITASRHDTSGKFIDDHNLAILDHIILVSEHQVMRTKCQNNIVLNL